MTMGQRIYQARVEAGLTQRQLAGDTMTRNMLSALEHDSANPSVATLQYLSEKLGRPVSYFLGEDVPQIPEYPCLQQARSAYDAGDYRECLEQLEQLPEAGSILHREILLLGVLSRLELAEQMLRQKRIPYARTLLEQAQHLLEQCPYAARELTRTLRILQAHCPVSEAALAGVVAQIPSEDDVLLLRARAALTESADAERYLNAMQQRDSPQWHCMMGEVLFRRARYKEAAQHYHRAEEQMGDACRERLEVCYREMEDYKMAYYYAKK